MSCRHTFWALSLLALTLGCGETKRPGTPGSTAHSDSGTVTPPVARRDAGSGDNVCQRVTRTASALPPRVLILQDLSSSLSSEWPQLRDAMVTVTDTFQDRMALGLVPFPTTYFKTAGDSTRNDSDCSIDPEQVISTGVGNGTRIVSLYQTISGPEMIGGTPTNAALDMARNVLGVDDPDGGAAGYVILVTDGDPNCMFSSNPGQSSSDEARAAVTGRIGVLAEAGVPTYVVGYNFTSGILDTWAAEGETGTAFRADDTAGLIAAMDLIAADVVSCSYELDAPVGDPGYVRVEVDGVTMVFDDPDGWRLGADRMTVTLQGGACERLRTEGTHRIAVTVECELI